MVNPDRPALPNSRFLQGLIICFVLGTLFATLLFVGAMRAGRQPAGLPFGLTFWVLAPATLVGGVLPGALLQSRFRNALPLLLTSLGCLVVLLIELLLVATSLSPGS